MLSPRFQNPIFRLRSDIASPTFLGMKSTTGQRIRALRKKRKQTQVELAFTAEIGQATLSEWESDMRRPSRRLLARLARALNVKPERIAP